MSTIVISLLCLLVSALISLYFGAKYFLLRKDLVSFKDAISEINPESNLPIGVNFKSDIFRNIYSSLKLILYNSRTNNINSEVLAMAVSIAKDNNSVASSLAEVIRDKIGSDLVGVAILNIENNKFRIMQSVDLPEQRISDAIELNCQNLLKDSKDNSSKWGYQQNKQSTWSDFSTFGIKNTLIIPLINKDETEGAIWLGLASTHISSKHAEVVRRLAQYAAASMQTAKRHKKEKVKQEKEKDFLLGLSHDLRAPGNRALFCVRDLLYDKNFNDFNREQLEIIEHSIQEQISMIEDVLDIAKHRDGVLISKPQRINLFDELTELLKRYRFESEQKKLQLEFSCEQEINVYIDKAHFKRILNNLMSNAIKFTKVGGVFIEVMEFDGAVEVVFKDTGCGLKSGDAVFKKFKQEQTSEMKKGYGLGLSLVKALTEINSGEVVNYSSNSSGASLGVRIPEYKEAENEESKDRYNPEQAVNLLQQNQ